MSIPVSVILKPLRNTVPILPVSFFVMSLRNFLMPLCVFKPTTVRIIPTGSTVPNPTVLHSLRKSFLNSVSGTNSFGLTHPATTAKWRAVTAKTRRNSTLLINFTLSTTSLLCSLSGSVYTTTFPCVLSTGSLPSSSYLVTLLCYTSLTNLHFRYFQEKTYQANRSNLLKVCTRTSLFDF